MWRDPKQVSYTWLFHTSKSMQCKRGTEFYHLIPVRKIEANSLFLLPVISPPHCFIWKDAQQILFINFNQTNSNNIFNSWINTHGIIFDSFFQHSSKHTKYKNTKKKNDKLQALNMNSLFNVEGISQTCIHSEST